MNKPASIDDALQRTDGMLEAMRAGARQAAREHLVYGLPMVVKRNGEIVYMPPDEFLRILDQQSADAGDEPATD